MKRKAIVLLSSVLAGALLVGGAFAAYAVTDNADPMGFVVTPGTYEEDTTTYVTMSFGDSSLLKNVENLKLEAPNRRVGVFSLVSTVKYTGDFTVKMVDRTEREEGDTNKHLIDFLRVGVYEGAQTAVEEGELPDATYLRGQIGRLKEEVEEPEPHIDVTNVNTATFDLVGLPAGKEYAVYLTLDEDATIYYSQMANDKVYVEVDWNAKSGDTATTYQVYAKNTAGWDKMFAYAWGDTGDNGAFPGKEMTLLRDDIYTITLPLAYKNIVFSAGDSNDDHKTDDLEMTEARLTAKETFWNGSAWVELEKEQVVSEGYKLNGSAMTEKTDTDKTDGRLAEYMVLDQEYEANAQLAFKDADDHDLPAANITWEGNVDATGKVKAAGELDVYLKVYAGTGEGSGQLFYAVYVSAPEGEPVEQGFLFSSNKGWGKVYMYAFKGEGESLEENHAWPGVELESIGENEFGEKQYALEWGNFTTIILNDGTGAQTVNIDVSTLADHSGIYLLNETDEAGHYLVGTF